MAIQIPNPGTGNGASGDNEFVLWSKVKDNFSDATHAASKLVGTAQGNVMEVGAFGLGGYRRTNAVVTKPSEIPEGLTVAAVTVDKLGFVGAKDAAVLSMRMGDRSYGTGAHVQIAVSGSDYVAVRAGRSWDTADVFDVGWSQFWTDRNATKDPNGFLKGASPIADIYSDKMDLNHDAIAQGDITLEKLGVGDYLVKGSLGFAQEGWYIETPKDANGNVLVAVVYKQLGNNDLSIKTYAKKFDDETGDIVANLLKPRDIPVGRFISLRLHELPKEPPVMPTESQSEV